MLEAVSIDSRLELLTEILTRENEMLEVERRLGARVETDGIQSAGILLPEQLKAIQKELGERDGVSDDVEHFGFTGPGSDAGGGQGKIEKEIDRLERTPPASPENVVLRNYLEWACPCPGAKRARSLRLKSC